MRVAICMAVRWWRKVSHATRISVLTPKRFFKNRAHSAIALKRYEAQQKENSRLWLNDVKHIFLSRFLEEDRDLIKRGRQNNKKIWNRVRYRGTFNS